MGLCEGNKKIFCPPSLNLLKKRASARFRHVPRLSNPGHGAQNFRSPILPTARTSFRLSHSPTSFSIPAHAWRRLYLPTNGLSGNTSWFFIQTSDQIFTALPAGRWSSSRARTCPSRCPPPLRRQRGRTPARLPGVCGPSAHSFLCHLMYKSCSYAGYPGVAKR